LNIKLVALMALPIVAGAVLLMVFFSMGNNTKAPSFTVTDVNGTVFKLDDQRGKIIIVEFMATWCRYCKAQIEELKLVHERFRDMPIVIISISIEPSDEPETLAEYRNNLGATWIFAQSYEVGLNYNVKVLPTTVIIDYDGKIRFRHEGVVEASKLIGEVSQLLNELKG
jgi:peroxiredoxin